MKQIFLFFVLIVNISFAQTKHILFEGNSKEYFVKELGNGKTASELKFRKEVKSKNEIHFYIEGQLFIFKGEDKGLSILNKEDFSKIKFDNLQELKENVDSNNALYPCKVFPDIELVENENSLIKKYKVKWKYYIE
ncbi:hypothetical protein [Tenacibaculum jejuense]|uniref:Uncharacterized protein n=1 Tax=Tenacibaculum jejuense TaxID=584609 RepID=A0A238U6K1_9FLAO|nr:hypothetical protein [Tenacibaculum jejuense]SNR14831.1 protein of unknown function [Tenacibaculum jejuense]